MDGDTRVPREASHSGVPVSPGDILADKYRVDRVIGVGGMGVVVAATHLDLLEPRAIKFMLPAYVEDSAAVARFLLEARACARLKGEHVAKVYDVGRLENGAPYMIMEYLTGHALSVVTDRREPIPPHEAAHYVLQACEALAEAHAAGIVHRDVKPENLFLAEGPGGVPTIKVLDFGISMVFGPSRELRVTKTSAILGSPFYMSPEQTRSTRDVDARADIWSLGVVLYQLVTGRVPFDGENITEVLSALLFADLHPPSAFVPEITAGLDRVVLRCLERDIDRRYASVGELAEDLAPFAPGGVRSLERIHQILPRGAAPSLRSVPAGTLRLADAAPASAAPSNPASTTSRAWRSPATDTSTGKRSRASLLGLAAAAVLVALIGVVLFARSTQSNRGPSEGAGIQPAPPRTASVETNASAAPTALAAPAPTPIVSADAPSASAAASSDAAHATPTAEPRASSSVRRPFAIAPPLHSASAAAEPRKNAPPPSASDPFGAGRQ